jgi:hypothetical protein
MRRQQIAALGSRRVGVYAASQSPQGVQRVVQNYVFFDMIRAGGKQFFDAGQNSLLGCFDPLGEPYFGHFQTVHRDKERAKEG